MRKLPPDCYVTHVPEHPHTRRPTWRVDVGADTQWTSTYHAAVCLAYAMYTTRRTRIKVKRAASTRVSFKGHVQAQGHWHGSVSGRPGRWHGRAS